MTIKRAAKLIVLTIAMIANATGGEVLYVKPCSGLIRVSTSLPKDATVSKKTTAMIIRPHSDYLIHEGQIVFAAPSEPMDVEIIIASIVEGAINIDEIKVVVSDKPKPLASIEERIWKWLAGNERDLGTAAGLEKLASKLAEGKATPVQSINLLIDIADKTGNRNFLTVRSAIIQLTDEEQLRKESLGRALLAAAKYYKGLVN